MSWNSLCRSSIGLKPTRISSCRILTVAAVMPLSPAGAA
jgi:hypothetical protein